MKSDARDASSTAAPLRSSGPPVRFNGISRSTEARDLMAGFDNRWCHWEKRGIALPETITPWNPNVAEATFLHNTSKAIEAWGQFRTQEGE